MYVCICNGYRDRDLREAVLRGAQSVEEAYRMLGAPPCCGTCVPEAQDLIDEMLTPETAAAA